MIYGWLNRTIKIQQKKKKKKKGRRFGVMAISLALQLAFFLLFQMRRQLLSILIYQLYVYGVVSVTVCFIK